MYHSEYNKALKYSKVKTIKIEDILPNKENMELAVDSLHKGRESSSANPLHLYPCKEDTTKYVLGDGHHRLLRKILNGKTDIQAHIDEESVSGKHGIELDPSEDYYGLHNNLENGYLIKRI